MSDADTVPEMLETLLPVEEAQDVQDDRRRRRGPKRNNIHAEIQELKCKLQEQQIMVEAMWSALSSSKAALSAIGLPDVRRAVSFSAPVSSGLSQPFLNQDVEAVHYGGMNTAHYNVGARNNYHSARGRHHAHRDGRVDARSFSQRVAQH
jgi:hypothetical protein